MSPPSSLHATITSHERKSPLRIRNRPVNPSFLDSEGTGVEGRVDIGVKGREGVRDGILFKITDGTHPPSI